jgi:hypothetical protein
LIVQNDQVGLKGQVFHAVLAVRKKVYIRLAEVPEELAVKVQAKGIIVNQEDPEEFGVFHIGYF